MYFAVSMSSLILVLGLLLPAGLVVAKSSAIDLPESGGKAVVQLKAEREAVLLLGGVLAQVSGAWRFHEMPANDPQAWHREDLWPVDRWAAGLYSPLASDISDVAVLPVVLALPMMDAFMALGGEAKWGPVFADGLVLAEALVWASALNLAVRSLRWHPRPLMFSEDAPMETRTAPEVGGSFYSGHANAAFVGAALFGAIFPRRFPEWNPAWVWGGGLAAASGVAVLRVTAGKHYPTDVVVGAAAGTLFGLLFAHIHKGNERVTPGAGRIEPTIPTGLKWTVTF